MIERNINAPLSKIVEAIKNQEDSIIEYYFSSATINEDKLTEALASLESSERELLEGFVDWINKTMHPFHFSKEIIDRYLAEKGVKND